MEAFEAWAELQSTHPQHALHLRLSVGPLITICGTRTALRVHAAREDATLSRWNPECIHEECIHAGPICP
jgi:hypothetical protein